MNREREVPVPLRHIAVDFPVLIILLKLHIFDVSYSWFAPHPPAPHEGVSLGDLRRLSRVAFHLVL